jgi:hypothetical protein
MLPQRLLALAALAGRAVVAAAATDAWPIAERGFARLLGRRDEYQTQLTEQRLEETRARLTGAAGMDSAQTRAGLAERWAGRVADLLEEKPDAEADLRALIQRIQAALPAGVVSSPGRAAAADGEVSVSAADALATVMMPDRMEPPNPTLEGSAAGYPGLGAELASRAI